jgi:hypothetical protein
VALLCEAYAASHLPSSFASSTSRSPAGCISPRSISSVALSRLIFDHLLRVRRGVKRCRKKRSSKPAFWLSIHP